MEQIRYRIEEKDALDPDYYQKVMNLNKYLGQNSTPIPLIDNEFNKWSLGIGDDEREQVAHPMPTILSGVYAKSFEELAEENNFENIKSFKDSDNFNEIFKINNKHNTTLGSKRKIS